MPISVLSQLSTLVVPSVVLIAVAGGVLSSILGLYAKRSAKNVISGIQNDDLDKLVRLTSERRLKKDEADMLSKILEDLIARMPEEEISAMQKKFLIEGINQPSRSGEARFIEELVSKRAKKSMAC